MSRRLGSANERYSRSRVAKLDGVAVERDRRNFRIENPGQRAGQRESARAQEDEAERGLHPSQRNKEDDAAKNQVSKDAVLDHQAVHEDDNAVARRDRASQPSDDVVR